MKLSEKDYPKILEIVKESIEKAGRETGVCFLISKIYLYGSQIQDKNEPNDIDVFVYVEDIADMCQENNDEVFLYQLVHNYLHHEQPSFKGIPLDINFKTYDFDLDGPFQRIDNV